MLNPAGLRALEHCDEILSELGYDEERIASLRERAIVAGDKPRPRT